MKSLYEYCVEQGNDLLLRQWHPMKNGELHPEDIAAHSHKKTWWICGKGHEWQADAQSRTLKKSGCPYCAGMRVIPGENDLCTLHPEVAKQWHPSKNGLLKPEEFMPHSNHKAWWMCEKGHEWQTSVYTRTGHKSGCPYCEGRKLIEGFNDLATVNPEVAEQWHPELNGELTPKHVMSGSVKRAWWICKKGHEWRATVSSRTVLSYGCPYCGGRKVLTGFNDLATVNPEIARQWNPKLNGDLTPEQVTTGSTKETWWICEKGHEWQARIASRTRLFTGCPYCAGKKVLAGFNDLATVEPKVAAQWHPDLNRDLTPAQVTAGCNKSVWWICSEGHVWTARIVARAGTRKTGCPVCAGNVRKDRLATYQAILDEIKFKSGNDQV